MSRRHALDVIRSWPAESREPASAILHVHGEPGHSGASELVWDDIGPWKRVVATRSNVVHDFPVRHTASVRSFIDYRVPANKTGIIDELNFGL